jgi:hypothetical protein
MSSIYAQIEAKYGFAIPEAYRRMERDGCFDLKHPGVYYEPANEPSYIWIPEAEWMSPADILKHEPAEYEHKGYVPFAFTGAHDHWCWWPEQDREAVVYCPHDSSVGRFDSPHFLASLYRRCLEYARYGILAGDEEEARRHFAHWVERLPAYFPAPWIDVLRTIRDAPFVERMIGRLSCPALLTSEDFESILARDLSFPRSGEEFEWMD